MQATLKISLSCLVCLSLLFLNGCGGGVPALTPAEQAEVDRYIERHGRDAIVHYMRDAVRQNEDERTVLKFVRYFVSQGAYVNVRDNTQGPLHDAARAGYLEVARFLVARGADVNDGSLIVAVWNNNIEMVKFLVARGADVNAYDVNTYGDSPLVVAVKCDNIEMVRFLVDHGADVNRGCPLFGPLLTAVASDNIETVKFLVSRGADVNAEIDGTPLLRWLRNPNPAIADFLVSQGARR